VRRRLRSSSPTTERERRGESKGSKPRAGAAQRRRCGADPDLGFASVEIICVSGNETKLRDGADRSPLTAKGGPGACSAVGQTSVRQTGAEAVPAPEPRAGAP